jgi:hypothetical protein
MMPLLSNLASQVLVGGESGLNDATKEGTTPKGAAVAATKKGRVTPSPPPKKGE